MGRFLAALLTVFVIFAITLKASQANGHVGEGPPASTTADAPPPPPTTVMSHQVDIVGTGDKRSCGFNLLARIIVLNGCTHCNRTSMMVSHWVSLMTSSIVHCGCPQAICGSIVSNLLHFCSAGMDMGRKRREVFRSERRPGMVDLSAVLDDFGRPRNVGDLSSSTLATLEAFVAQEQRTGGNPVPRWWPCRLVLFIEEDLSFEVKKKTSGKNSS